MLIRTLRLARLARVVRLMVTFKHLYILVQGLYGSLLMLLWTCVIVAILMYMFAIVGLELIQPEEGQDLFNAQVSNFNEGMGASMLTLLQFLTMDSIGSIYRPLIMETSSPVKSVVITVYIILFVLIVSIAVMNLVMAIMVDTAMKQSTADKEAKAAWELDTRKKAIPELKRMFAAMDADGSGELELNEITDAPPVLTAKLQEVSGMQDMVELFKLLDYDNSESISIDEFCEGILNAMDSDKPLEILRIMKQCNEIMESNKKVIDLIEGTQKQGPGQGARKPAASEQGRVRAAAAEPTAAGGAGQGGGAKVESQQEHSLLEHACLHAARHQARFNTIEEQLSAMEAKMDRLLAMGDR